jgi:hypothetical protein
MLMIGFGVGLITLGFVGIALGNYMEVQRRADWVLVFQRAGASIANFSVNLSSGGCVLGVSVWVHNYAEGFYSISDANGNQVVIVHLANTDQSSEWKYNEGYFEIIDSGYYTFKLVNATFSSARSTVRLSQPIYVDEFLYPYRSLFWIGVFFLVVGVPLVAVGSATSLLPNPKD